MRRLWQWTQRLFVPSHHNAYRPHLLRRRALLFLLGVALVAEAGLIFTLMARQGGADFIAAVIQSEIISLTNAERARGEAAVLTESLLLDQSAQAKADDMAAKSYFSHQGPDGKQPWLWIEEAGYDYQYAGENLAVRFVDSKDVVVGWMASPTHRANIVKPVYTDIGVGIAQGMYKGQPATFVVQHLGKPSAEALSARAQGAVLGAETGPPASLGDTLARSLGKIISEPRSTTAWILGTIITLLMLALFFAFFHHIQVQARDLLVPGALVAGIALTLLVVNTSFLSSGISPASQPAGVASYSGVVLTPEAAALER